MSRVKYIKTVHLLRAAKMTVFGSAVMSNSFEFEIKNVQDVKRPLIYCNKKKVGSLPLLQKT